MKNILHILLVVDLKTEFAKNFGGPFPTSIGEVISKILPSIYYISLLLVLVYLTWGAYRYLIAGGDPKAIDGAKKHLTWAVIGLIIVFLSYGLFQLLNSLINNVYTL